MQVTGTSFDQVKATLLRRPSLINSRKVAQELLAEREQCTPAQALKLLGSLTKAKAYQELFKTTMPEEFKRDTGSLVNIEKRFYEALGFPVNDRRLMSVFAPEADAGVLESGIPIQSMAWHLCPNCFHFEGMPPAFQLAIIVFPSEAFFEALSEEPTGNGEDPDVEIELYWNSFAAEFKLSSELKPAYQIQYAKARLAFLASRSPLRFLPLLSSAIEYNTGNIFFDFDPEEGDLDDYLEWTPENVKFLRAQFTAGKALDRNLHTCIDWFSNKREARGRIIKALRIVKRAEESRK